MKICRPINKTDAEVVWEDLKGRFGVRPVNYNSVIGRVIKSLANRKMNNEVGNAASDFLTDLLSTAFTFFSWVLLPFTPGTKTDSIQEIKLAGHETTHRWDQQKPEHGTPLNWYRKYFRYPIPSRVAAEVRAYLTDVCLAYAMGGRSAANAEITSIERKIKSGYRLSEEQQKILVAQVRAGFEAVASIGPGVSINPVTDCVIDTLIRTGAIDPEA